MCPGNSKPCPANGTTCERPLFFFLYCLAEVRALPTTQATVRSRYKRQLIRLNMEKKWPTRTGMEDSRPIFFCKRFSYNENALYRYRLFHSRTKSASVDSHMYVSGWLLCCHEPKYLQVSLHQALSGPDQDDIFCQDLIHCSGR